jgi:hypothetical protein
VDSALHGKQASIRTLGIDHWRLIFIELSYVRPFTKTDKPNSDAQSIPQDNSTAKTGYL